MVIEFLMFLILLITEFTVKVGSEVFQGFGNCLLFVNIILVLLSQLFCVFFSTSRTRRRSVASSA